MPDLSDFNPTSIEELIEATFTEARTAIGQPIENFASIPAHLTTLAEASLETMKALAEGRLDRQTAEEIMIERKQVLEQIARFSAFMTLVVAQKLSDAVFRVIGWAIFNRTGLNLVPDLVRPD
jgi:hypothetical protein